MNPSTQQYQPKTLKRLGDTGFLVEWKDGHKSEYPFPYLRRMCPCAECSAIRHKGLDVHSLFAPDGDGDFSLIQVSEDVLPLDIQLVGRYAVQFRWKTMDIRLASTLFKRSRKCARAPSVPPTLTRMR